VSSLPSASSCDGLCGSGSCKVGDSKAVAFYKI
jgi:hypothetical protein